MAKSSGLDPLLSGGTVSIHRISKSSPDSGLFSILSPKTTLSDGTIEGCIYADESWTSGCRGSLAYDSPNQPLGTWWAIKDLNLGPLPCEGSALTTELIAPCFHSITTISYIKMRQKSLGRLGRYSPISPQPPSGIQSENGYSDWLY